MGFTKVITKERVIEIVETFDLTIDYDQWDERGWIRVNNEHTPAIRWEPFIIWKNDYVLEKLEDVMPNTEADLKKELKEYLMKLGAEQFKEDFKKLLGLID